jgi:hypothetical protein
MMMEITMATIGRLMKNFAIGMKDYVTGSGNDQISDNIIRFSALAVALGTVWDQPSYRL